jgi:hypothetical protein
MVIFAANNGRFPKASCYMDAILNPPAPANSSAILFLEQAPKSFKSTFIFGTA